MKPFLILAVSGACVYFFLHPAPEPSHPETTKPPAPKTEAQVPAQPATTPSNFLKRPTDRAREVTGQVRQRANESF